MIDIKTISGELLLSVPILQDAVCHEELMVSDYVALSWNSDNNEELPAGAYIEFEGERYSLLEPYKPTMVTEGEFKYAPQFHSRVSAWDKQPACVYTYESDGVTVKTREFDWTIVGSPADAMQIIKQAIKNETGEEWNVKIAESLPASIEISSQTSSIKSVLASIADQCQTEYWVEKATNTLHLSKCEFGEEVALEVGSNIGVPSVMMGGNEYYTRYYALGSSRNITQGTAGVNGSVNKRLTLDPTAFPHGYKDVKGHFENGVFVSDLKLGEIFSKVVVFDDIYPSSDLQIHDVRARMKYRLDGSGNKIVVGGTEDAPVYDQYAIWYFKIKDFTFSEDLLIAGLPLSVHFKSGRLAGQEFELIYHAKAKTEKAEGDVIEFNVEAGDYEIKFKESGGTILPDIVYIIPQNDDEIILFNIEMPSDYTASARARLLEALDEQIEKDKADNNTYEFSSNPIAFHESGLILPIGHKVVFSNGGKELSARVLMVERKLDYSFEQRMRVGSNIIKGTTKELKDEVANLNHNVDVLAAFNDLSKSIQDSYARNQALVNEAIATLTNGVWRVEGEELVTEKRVRIKNDLIVAGDTSSSGEGEPVIAGIQGVRVNGTTHYDDDGDGVVDLGTIESGGGGLTSVSWGDIQGTPPSVSTFNNDVPYVTDEELRPLGEEIELLSSMWHLDENGNLVTDKQVLIKNNLIIDGDTSSGGEGEDTPIGGISGVKVNGVTYYDDNGDGIVDLGTISGGVSEITASMITSALGYTPANGKDYLPLTGGKINGAAALDVNRNDGPYGSLIKFSNTSGELGYIGFTHNKIATIWSDINADGYTLIHSGNVGSYNAGGAKKLTPYNGICDYAAGISTMSFFTDWGLTNTLGSYLYGISMESPDASYKVQVGHALWKGLYWRDMDAGTWTSWKKIVTENADGNVLIGTTTDNSAKLQVNGHIDFFDDGDYSGVIGLNRRSAIGGMYNVSYAGWQIHNHLGTIGFLCEPLSGSPGERMVITANGNVGIGTTSPLSKLQVDGQINLSAGTNNNYSFIRSENYSSNISLLRIGTCYGYSSEASAITVYSGYVGIGVDIPQYKLDVNGDIALQNLYSTGALFMNNGSEGIYVGGSQIHWHNSSNAYAASLINFSATQITIHPNVVMNGFAESAYNRNSGISASLPFTDFQWRRVWQGGYGSAVRLQIGKNYYHMQPNVLCVDVSVGYNTASIVVTSNSDAGSHCLHSIRVTQDSSGNYYIDVQLYNSVANTDTYIVCGNSAGGDFKAFVEADNTATVLEQISVVPNASIISNNLIVAGDVASA